MLTIGQDLMRVEEEALTLKEKVARRALVYKRALESTPYQLKKTN